MLVQSTAPGEPAHWEPFSSRQGARARQSTA